MPWKSTPVNGTEIGWIPADWPAPDHVHAGTTTRSGGASRAPYNALNLAEHVGDDQDRVDANRQHLRRFLDLPADPHWLRQVHGNDVINACEAGRNTTADGSYTDTAGIVCAVLIADCLPLLLSDNRGTEIAAVHVGWRGFSKDIIGRVVAMFRAPPRALLAWLGPCIGANHYQVGDDVRLACLKQSTRFESAFTAAPGGGRWRADLEGLARRRLEDLGLGNISGGGHCTFAEKSLFYSYRRDGTTGRMASLIWRDQERSANAPKVEY